MIPIEEIERFKPLEDINKIIKQVKTFHYYVEESGQMSSSTWCKLDGIEKLLDELFIDLGGAGNAADAFD